MQRKALEKLAWLLVYSGLLLATLGWFLQVTGAAWGHAVVIAGLADAAAGGILIWWRSRMKETDT